MSEEQKPAPRQIRKLRHWKQRFNKNAKFIWRKRMRWAGDTYTVPGELVPEDFPKTKLYAFWEAGAIELAEFEEPTNVATGRAQDDPSLFERVINRIKGENPELTEPEVQEQPDSRRTRRRRTKR